MRHLKAVSGSINFVNMDEIARGLSPLEPVAAQTEAARIALARARAFIREKATFAMEAALAGRTRLNLMQEALAQGLSTALLYFSVRDPTICLERIARRVAEGGPDVEASIVRRRFLRSLANLPVYRSASDLWRIDEASGPKPALALEGRRGTGTTRSWRRPHPRLGDP
jgi:predicted ABC-type ATPase